jgi:hypothetical protein
MIMSNFGCRDCATCIAPGAAKAGRALGAGALHFFTFGGSYLASRAFMSHCPQCTHLTTRHHRRADGSYID